MLIMWQFTGTVVELWFTTNRLWSVNETETCVGKGNLGTAVLSGGNKSLTEKQSNFRNYFFNIDLKLTLSQCKFFQFLTLLILISNLGSIWDY